MEYKIKSVNYVHEYRVNVELSTFTLMTGPGRRFILYIFRIINSKPSRLFRDRNNERRTHSKRFICVHRYYYYTINYNRLYIIMTLNIIWAKREMAAAALEVSIFYCYLLYNSIIIDRYMMIIMRDNFYSISYYRTLLPGMMMSTSLPLPTASAKEQVYKIQLLRFNMSIYLVNLFVFIYYNL